MISRQITYKTKVRWCLIPKLWILHFFCSLISTRLHTKVKVNNKLKAEQDKRTYHECTVSPLFSPKLDNLITGDDSVSRRSTKPFFAQQNLYPLAVFNFLSSDKAALQALALSCRKEWYKRDGLRITFTSNGKWEKLNLLVSDFSLFYT